MTQAFLSNPGSLVPGAALAASSVRASRIFERLEVSRAGNGSIALAGSYTGSQDALIDIEIDAGGATPRATAPAFSGIGSGALAVDAVAPGATVQSIVLTLADLGSTTAVAQLDIGAVVLRARVAGVAGNQIRLTVTSALSAGAPEHALLADWAAGAAWQTGAQWDFGALPLTATGELPEAAPRLRIGNDPAIYRQFKEFYDGQWRYGFSPAVERTLPAKARVFPITGAYAVAVSDGASTENYTATTLHDFLDALSASALLEVAGVVAADRTPGGASAIDLPLRTSAWVARAEGGVEYLPAPSAPTETVTFVCTESRAGADKWSVSGAVSGNLPQAVTGQVYSAGSVASALIPAKGKTGAVSGETAWKFTPASREGDGDAELPSVCLNPVKLGRNAQAGKSVTFVFDNKPQSKCKCDGKTVGAVSNFLLGLEGESMSNLDPALQSRATALYNWRRELVEVHCELATGATVPEAWAVKFRLVSTDTGFVNPWNTLRFSTEGEADTVVTQLGAASISPTTGNIDLPAGIAIFPGLVRYDGADVLPDGINATIEDIAKVSVPAVTDPVAARVSLRDTTWLESVVTALVDALADVYTDATALAAWDGFFADAQAQAAFIAAAGDDLSSEELVAELYQRQQAQMDYVRVLAGILPKSDATSGGGAGVWRDDPLATHWWVDPTGRYLPAFSNRVYYSCLRDTGSLTGRPGTVVNLQEFAFGLVCPCEHLLKKGDQITITIASVGMVNTSYQQGETLHVDVVGAQPAWLTGGLAGSDEKTWLASGSVDGALAPVVLPAGGSVSATRAGVGLTLNEGGIAFELGDAFDFSVEAGVFRWRKDGGAWSPAIDLPDSGAVPLADGVSARFTPGMAPSFVAGDTARFSVLQPFSPEAVRRYTSARWQWEGAAASLLIDFGAAREVGMVALTGHALPPGAACVLSWSLDGADFTPVALDAAQRVAVGVLPAVVSARYLRIALSDAPGGALGWVFAGVPFASRWQADSVKIKRGWALRRGGDARRYRLVDA